MKLLDGAGNIPPYPHIDGKDVRFPCYAEVKLDGEANIYASGCLISKASGKIRTACPITNTLSKIVDKVTMLFGELHWEDGKAGALYDFLSHAKDDKLNFTIFDVYHPTLDGADYETRREWLISNILNNAIWKGQSRNVYGAVRVTRPMFIENLIELNELVKNNQQDEWEGLVTKNPKSILYSGGLRSSQTQWVKLKHKTTGDYQVINISTTQERMDIRVGHRECGVKLVNKYKPYVKVGDMVEIEHMGVLAAGGLRHPVFRGKVCQGGKINP